MVPSRWVGMGMVHTHPQEDYWLCHPAGTSLPAGDSAVRLLTAPELYTSIGCFLREIEASRYIPVDRADGPPWLQKIEENT